MSVEPRNTIVRMLERTPVGRENEALYLLGANLTLVGDAFLYQSWQLHPFLVHKLEHLQNLASWGQIIPVEKRKHPGVAYYEIPGMKKLLKERGLL